MCQDARKETVYYHFNLLYLTKPFQSNNCRMFVLTAQYKTVLLTIFLLIQKRTSPHYTAKSPMLN